MTITIKEKITEALENCREATEPLELFRALGLNDKDQFAAAVQELEQEGVLVTTKKGRLLSVKSAGLTPAQMISQSKGFSFARPLEGGEDIYVAQEDRKRAMLGDTVLLRDIRDSGKGLSGRVERDHPERNPPLYWNRSPPGPGLRTGIGWRFSLSGAG